MALTLMILNDFDIAHTKITTHGEHGQEFQRHLIEPFCSRTLRNGMTFGLSAAGYDVRCAQEVTLYRGDFVLLSTLEHFHMPDDLVATVMDKSTWARRGLSLLNTIIEPGWHGVLTLEAVLHAKGPVRIMMGDPIAQIVFQRLTGPAVAPYRGKYQGQPARPVEAILEPA